MDRPVLDPPPADREAGWVETLHLLFVTLWSLSLFILGEMSKIHQ